MWRQGNKVTTNMRLLVWALIQSDWHVCTRKRGHAEPALGTCTHTHTDAMRTSEKLASYKPRREAPRQTNQ